MMDKKMEETEGREMEVEELGGVITGGQGDGEDGRQVDGEKSRTMKRDEIMETGGGKGEQKDGDDGGQKEKKVII